MTGITKFDGVRVIDGVEMMSTKGIVAVCEKIGEPKTHGHILDDVRNMLKKLDERKIGHDSVEEKDNRGYTSQFWLSKLLCDTLISGYSIPIRYAVHEEFDRLQNQPKLPTTYIEALKALVESEESKQKALAKVAVVEEQNDYQAKALITSMTNNGKLTKKVKVLEAKIRGFEEYVSIHAYLAREKIKSWSSVTGYVSTNGLVTRLKKMGMNNNEWALKQFEGQEYATTVFDVEFLDSQKDFIVDYIEKAIQKKTLKP